MKIYFAAASFLLLTILLLTTKVVVNAQRTPLWGDCDPINPSQCSSPMPNDFYAVASSTTNTGRQVNMSGMMLPVDKKSREFNPMQLRFNNRDGFGTGGPLLFALGGQYPNLNGSEVPSWKNIAPSLSYSSSPTLLLDLGPANPATNGASPTVTQATAVPHWVEVDERSKPLSFEPAILIYPAKILDPARRYAVVVRNLNDRLNVHISPSSAFRSLIDGKPDKSHPSIVDRSSQYYSLFSYLESKYSIDRKTLQLAWFFTTQSDADQTSDLRVMQQDALKRMPAQGPNFYITSTVPNPTEDSSAYIFGQMEVPMYLNNHQPGGTLVRDPVTQKPVCQGLANFSFELVVPKAMAAATGTNQTGFLHIGHGLFLNLTVAENPTYQKVANLDNYLIGAVNWLGLCSIDIPWVLETFAGDFNNLISSPDRLAQSQINQEYLTFMFTHSLPRSSLFKNKLNVNRLKYTADSLGGILGGVFVSMSTKINDAVLRVDGAPFGLLLPRSWLFFPLWDLMVARGWTTFERMIIIYIIELILEPVGPPAFLRHLVQDPWLGQPKRVAMMHGLSDAFVTSISGEVSARTVNAARFTGNVHEVGETPFGFGPWVNGSVTYPPSQGGVIFQLYDFGNPPIPDGDTPVDPKYNTHGCVRPDPRSIAFMRHFFTTGEFKDFCDGKGCTKLANSTCK